MANPVNKPNLSPSLPRYLNEQQDISSSFRRDVQNIQENRAGISLGSGLQAWYFNDTGLTAGSAKGPVVAQEFIGDIDWTNRSIAGSTTNWTLSAFGYIEFPHSGTHTIRLTYDDGATLTLGNTILINDYVVGAVRTTSASYTAVDPAPYITPILLTYFQGASGSRLKLEWSISGAPFEVVPKSNLHLELPAWIPVNSNLANVLTPFSNSWVNFNASYPARFRLRDDSVELGGLISGGTPPSVAITLPRSYGSNAFEKIYAVTSNNAFGSVRIQGRGVVVQAGNTAWVSLDGISFGAHSVGQTVGSPVTS